MKVKNWIVKNYYTTVCNLDRVHFEYFWNSKPVVSPIYNQLCNMDRNSRTYNNISFFMWRKFISWFLFFFMYTCHLNLFNHNFTAAAGHASACRLATNVQTSMRNVKLYWINIDIFCVEHLKLIVLCLYWFLCWGTHERHEHDTQYCKFSMPCFWHC